jgi:formate/nitrite transporter FocA (FNT family)
MTTLFTQAPTTVANPKAQSDSSLRSLLAGLILAIGLLGAVAQTVPAAHADADVTSNFVGALASKGITYGSKQAVIAAAHQVCDELDKGEQPTDVANDVMTQTNLDAYHAGFFVGVSIAAMCPRHSQ